MKTTVLECGCSITRDMHSDAVISVHFCDKHLNEVLGGSAGDAFMKLHFPPDLGIEVTDEIVLGDGLG